MTRALIERLEASGADTFLVNAAGCGSHLKDLGHLFQGDPAWHDHAVAFSRKVKDVTEFLAAVAPRAARHPIPAKVAYHSPCHLGHAQGIQDPPRALLRAIPGLELVEIAEGDQCCGSAGIYNLVQVAGVRRARRAQGGRTCSPPARRTWRQRQPRLHAPGPARAPGEGRVRPGRASHRDPRRVDPGEALPAQRPVRRPGPGPNEPLRPLLAPTRARPGGPG